jgi:nicotinamidase-related amidase
MTESHQESTTKLPGLALIGLDIQSTFVRALPAADTFTSRCQFAVAAATLLEIPAIFTEQVPEKLGPTLPEILAGAPDAPVFEKSHFSCFGAEGFEECLRERQIHHLLVIGLETPICVYQSVIQAIDQGMEVTVLSDCVGARRSNDAEAALQAMSGAGAHILPAETVFYSILGHTGHPCFRPFNTLVKQHTQPQP